MSAKKKSKFSLWVRRRRRTLKKVRDKLRGFGTMNTILVIIAVSLLVFTVEMIRLFREQGQIPDTLITCVFAALGGECGVMGWIKTTKERMKDRKYELEDRKYSERTEGSVENSPPKEPGEPVSGDAESGRKPKGDDEGVG